MDRNGNGAIDNGTELFGDATDLDAGGKAADGFAALAQEDTNGDGKVSSLDARWNNLRVWRDLNQNGISEAGELVSRFDALDIASIATAKTAHSQSLPDGNQIADLGSFTRGDGSAGTVGEVSRLGDVNLATDTFHRQFTDTVPLAAGVVGTARTWRASGLGARPARSDEPVRARCRASSRSSPPPPRAPNNWRWSISCSTPGPTPRASPRRWRRGRWAPGPSAPPPTRFVIWPSATSAVRATSTSSTSAAMAVLRTRTAPRSCARRMR
ncbi:MAG: hypothetical protein MZW92_24470 [Comamonadaceae bacterium]|nr:hypothetical protein [Comamonadaceae bacterium]